MDYKKFLEAVNFSEDEFKRSGCTFEVLAAIGEHYEKILPSLTSSAKMISSTIQTFENVHSVRWRIKDPIHLLKKIIRKNLEEGCKSKWKEVTVDNYLSVITDLIGVRALHLFRDECVHIDERVRDYWELSEDVVAYVRDGDEPNRAIEARGARTEKHDAGYRSIHYIIKIQPAKLTYFAEIQVRTIFQEGWSEVDHTVRYPDFSGNEQVGIFLRLFAGLAGSADEMGLFAKDLSVILKGAEDERRRLIAAHDQVAAKLEKATKEVEATLEKLEGLETENQASKGLVAKLRKDISAMKRSESQIGLSGLDMAKYNLLSGRFGEGRAIDEFVRGWELKTKSKK